ncbi:MAG: O-antigen ligase family protein, partial [Bacilli bacterium]|nr:O-antigen ligase family protein [Bacilli bacterium]
MKKINSFITNNIYKIILIFLFIQPIIDVITGVSINYLNINLNISSIIRLLFLFFCIYYLIFINKNNKKKNITYLLSYLIYLILYSISVIIYKDINVLSYEIKNNLNIFYFPIIFLGLYNMFKNNNI